MTCQACSQNTNFERICNVANFIKSYDSTAKSEYYGACCSSDDYSQICSSEDEGGYTGNECSYVGDQSLSHEPIWFTACPVPKDSPCGQQQLALRNSDSQLENYGLKNVENEALIQVDYCTYDLIFDPKKVITYSNTTVSLSILNMTNLYIFAYEFMPNGDVNSNKYTVLTKPEYVFESSSYGLKLIVGPI